MTTEPELRRRLREAEERLHRLENERPVVPPNVRDLSDVKANKATDGQVLAYNKATGLWKPGSAGSAGNARFVYGSVTAKSIPASTATVIDWGTPSFYGEGTSFVTQSAGVFTFTKAGWYRITCAVRYAVTGDGNRAITAQGAGATAFVPVTLADTYFTHLSFSYVQYRNPGQTEQFRAFQSHTAAVTLEGNFSITELPLKSLTGVAV